jgi:GH15 family glucan-1,4-alpha-glucosidase
MISASGTRYPPMGEYALIGDCHSAALVSRSGSIDWCCMPRFDSGSIFGRLLDWDSAGFCSISARHPSAATAREYIKGTLVLVTTFVGRGGEARMYDCFTMREGGATHPHRQLLRIVEGVRGRLNLELMVSPRFDYGEVRPWIRQHGIRMFSAIGGNDALFVTSDVNIEPVSKHDLAASFSVRAGERARLSMQFVRPETLERDTPGPLDPDQCDDRLEETRKWWLRWSSDVSLRGPDEEGAVRSAIVLKGLTNAPTGAIAAAPTTSLPETPGGGRNWDYRYSWIRDSCFTARSLAELGPEDEADGFRRFIERTSAGTAEQLQILYGLGGERRLQEQTLDQLEGYRGARPVRVGNAAANQFQLDALGELLDLAWRWHRRGHSPDDDYWRFLVELVDAASARWTEPDSGIWEVRGRKMHFVHSKAMCWAAMDRGLKLAKECARRAPVGRWSRGRRELRAEIESRGYDKKRGVFVRAFGSKALDASLLLLPTVDFVAWDDERMVRTADTIREELMESGLLLRYRAADGLGGKEGAFLPCSFWLVECLARQGREQEAREIFDRAVATGNDLGLFAEEFDGAGGEMLGNFPQGLTHLSHIAAAVALADVVGR